MWYPFSRAVSGLKISAGICGMLMKRIRLGRLTGSVARNSAYNRWSIRTSPTGVAVCSAIVAFIVTGLSERSLRRHAQKDAAGFPLSEILERPVHALERVLMRDERVEIELPAQIQIGVQGDIAVGVGFAAGRPDNAFSFN